MDSERRETIDRAQAEHRIICDLELACDMARFHIAPLALPEGWATVLPPAIKARLEEAQALTERLVQDMEALGALNERKLDEAFASVEDGRS